MTSIKPAAILKGEGLPDYDKITPEEITENIPKLIKDLNEKLNKLEEQLGKKLLKENFLRWEDVMPQLYEIGEKLRWSWGVVSHLNAVCNSSELREVHSNQQPKIVRFSNQLAQNEVIFKALSNLKEQGGLKNETQIRIIETELITMKNKGIGLELEEKTLFNSRSERLAKLSTTFSNNVLDTTKNWSLLLKNNSEVEGLPDRALETLALAAKEAGDKAEGGNDPTASTGPWRVGLDLPRYIPFQTYAKNRPIREKVYRAFVSRASHGELNNKKIIEEILDLRNKQARQLGYKNWCEISLATKMADNEEAVEKLLEELRLAAMPHAKKELIQLTECAKRNGEDDDFDLSPWDISFWAEVLRKEKYELDQEKLRPWFPLDQVLNGLFNLCKRLFEIEIEEASDIVPLWHKDVRFFDVKNLDGQKIASFYLDPFSRPATKRGGAWMDECLCRNQKEKDNIILPVAYLVCNQTPPIADEPSLMSFEEVETLFHEFGHGLQHMLTTVDYPQAAGINNVEWDAVELASQFMENWCLEEQTISEIAIHWKTKEPLAESEITKLRQSRTFNSGLATLRQIHFALTDLKLHSQWNEDLGISPDELRRQIAKKTTVLAPIPEDQFLCAFSHIFAGGYAAGYYSYKWAEVLSSDAFAAFEEAGLANQDEIRKIGKKYRDSVLSLGGSRSPNQVFKKFRGRLPSTKALIRHSGLD
ncbi:M3 family metallopeptidase [Prochlorococcus marinus]|uniref:oligopeptidase A n=1 Tax=Prochlorococcus marinus XMU1408 TaxID=2213228 RepID=A0A318R1I8_PROMR|nr:M3 family metallopeptidase [Prochlorococcus marinus]MBW3041619.1 peptidase M3 [Prochlorococcus marinus str. XMU1408]PYE02775.1 peptidase M3 [Prochlorococcus marinus XMU1408]